MNSNLILFCLLAFLSPGLQAQNAVDLHPLSLEALWPERVAPETVDEAFSSGFDLPAVYLNVTPEQLNNAYKAKYPKRLPNVEIEVILSLNLKAARLWQTMLQCQMTEQKADAAENVRQAYLEQDDYCPKHEQKSAAIERQLGALHREVGQLLLSSKMHRLDYMMDSFAKLTVAASNNPIHEQQAQSFNNRASILPLVHPLFMQMVAENYAAAWRFYNIDDEEEAQFNQYLFEISLNEKSSLPLADDEKARAYTILNILAVFEMIPAGNCAFFGLWPGALRAVLGSSSDYDHCYGNECLQVNTINSKLNNACGFVNDLIGRSLYVRGKKRFGNNSYTEVSLRTLLSLPSVLANAFTPVNQQFVEHFRELHEDYEEAQD